MKTQKTKKGNWAVYDQENDIETWTHHCAGVFRQGLETLIMTISRASRAHATYKSIVKDTMDPSIDCFW